MNSAVQIQEQTRLASLDRYDILDTPAEEAFDRITRLTRRFFDVPMSTVTLIDGHRQWFKSRQGVSACETPKGPAFCSVVVREARPLIVPDATADERFADNAFVTGDPHIRFYAGVPLRTPEGHSIGTLCAMDTKPRAFTADQTDTLTDLARIVMSELELRVLAMTDGLTGALSRRAFRDELSRTFALALRHRHELSCIMLDVDRFKVVNDEHGHPVGDLVLAAAAAACREELRKSDVLGRLGGEEFAVLLPHTGLASALKVAEKLRSAIARLEIPTPRGSIKVTASFGITALDGSVGSPDTLLKHADAALYLAKDDGRNRCVEWRPATIAQQGIRRRVLKAGQISFNGGRSAIDCTVRSLSEESASLKIVTSAGIPETFKLLIESDGFSRLCRIEAKADRDLEVAFV
ncbi:diguanylate cyclase (GGDEF)-like protein [Methylobacterium sp. BE186]|uniref:sensor domain-containing diguanylate cyclase n=1 Tax=Methylobacterium sp. BE186 TaxID=2817715 RepID=UPI00286183C4|nr:sensor domain-containing diguanylate cyclase [Methylobacterium sp. BE186]MDR7040525.1 diguanylate cyclase (GGDEF)-like protein [Methylobacterium sp. BE186]